MRISANEYRFLERDISRILNLCGWYIGDKKKAGEKYLISLEPRFPTQSTKAEKFSAKVIVKFKTFYHVSFGKYREKILSFGLIPSNTSRREFFHPERIYLFGELDDARAFLEIHRHEPITREINQRRVRNTDKLADIRYQPIDPSELCVFAVDLSSCVDSGRNVVLYHDNRWHGDAESVFFTQNTIPPQYVTLFGN